MTTLNIPSVNVNTTNQAQTGSQGSASSFQQRGDAQNPQPSQNTDTNNTSSTSNTSSNAPAQNNNSNSNVSGQNGNDDSHFSKVLAARQNTDAGSTTTTDTSGQKSQDTSATASASNDNANNLVASIMALLLQSQNQVPQQTQPAATGSTTDATGTADATNAADSASSASNTNTPASLDDLLKELSALLEQAVAQSNAGNTAPATDASAQTGASSTGGTSGSSSTPHKQPSLADLAALLQSLLQQQTAPAQPADTTQSTAQAQTNTDNLTVGDASTSSTPSLSTVLAQLAQLLGQNSSAGNSTDNADPKATESAVSDVIPNSTTSQPVIPKTVTPDITTTTLTNTQPLQDLQQLVARIVETLSANNNPAPKQDTKTDDNTATNGTTPVTGAVAASSAPQGAPTTSFAKELSQAATPQSPADQVLVQIKNAVSDGSSQVRIQLHPEDLGSVQVQINTSADGKTGVTITADNRQTLAMLQNEAKSLESALRDIGLKTDSGSLNFNLRDQGQDARNSSKQQQGGYTNVAPVSEIEDTGFSTAGSLYRLSVQSQQGLDIRV